MSQSKSHTASLARPLPNCAESLFASFCGSIDAKSPANQGVTFTALAVSYWLSCNGGSVPGGSRCLLQLHHMWVRHLTDVQPTQHFCFFKACRTLSAAALFFWSSCSLWFVLPNRLLQEISCEQIHMEADSSWHAHVLQPKHNIHTAPCFYFCILFFFFFNLQALFWHFITYCSYVAMLVYW